MKGVELLRTDDGFTLYEVKRKFNMDKFKHPLNGESADILKRWTRCDKILISKKTNEYLCVNVIEEAQMVEDDLEK